jgi:inner membrane protein
MASLGHIAVGMVAGSWEARRERPLLASSLASMTLFAALSLLPDADVLGFRFGVAYGEVWGHRGATHSLLFAVGVALFLALCARLAGRHAPRVFLLTALVVASHGLLDALTDGGLGVALLWPLTNARYFAPFTPIPVAPIGRGLWSARGLYVLCVEALWFSPCFAYVAWNHLDRTRRSVD